MLAIDIAKNYIEISKLTKIDGVLDIPKPVKESFNFKTRDELNEINKYMKLSLDQHKEALEHKKKMETFSIDSKKIFLNECLKLAVETASFNVASDNNLNRQIVEIDENYNKELIEAKHAYEAACEKLKQKRNALIDAAKKKQENEKKKHFNENETKKQAIKKEIFANANVEQVKFETCKDKLISLNKMLTEIINTSNKMYEDNKSIWEQFMAL